MSHERAADISPESIEIGQIGHHLDLVEAAVTWRGHHEAVSPAVKDERRLADRSTLEVAPIGCPLVGSEVVLARSGEARHRRSPAVGTDHQTRAQFALTC